MSEPVQNLSAQALDMSEYLENLINDQRIDVPLLPDVASRVLALSNDPDSDAAQLAKLIQGDQSLAGHVMRIANSAAYTPNASMVSLQQAIARLGMSLITEISLAASLNSKIFNAPGFEQHLSDIWTHALCTAIWAKELARASKQNVEASFLCGLLHSIGRPAVLQAVAEYAEKKNISIEKEDATDLEQQFHSRFGTIIVQKWNMPVLVQECVKHSQNYHQAKQNKAQAMVINGASKIASALLWPDKYSMDDVITDAVFAELNLYHDEIAALIERSDHVSASLEAMRR